MRVMRALLILILWLSSCSAADAPGGLVIHYDPDKIWGTAKWPCDEGNLIAVFRLPEALEGAGIQVSLSKSMRWLPAEYRLPRRAHLVVGIFQTVRRAQQEMLYQLTRWAGPAKKQLPDGQVIGDVLFCSDKGVTILFIRRNAFVGVRTGWRGARTDPETASKVAKLLDRALAAAPKKLPQQPDPMPTVELRAPFPKRMVVGEEVNVELRIRSKANIVGVYSRLWKSDGGVIQASRIEKTRTAERFRVRAIRVGKATLEFLASDGNAMTGFLRVTTEVVPKPAP